MDTLAFDSSRVQKTSWRCGGGMPLLRYCSCDGAGVRRMILHAWLRERCPVLARIIDERSPMSVTVGGANCQPDMKGDDTPAHSAALLGSSGRLLEIIVFDERIAEKCGGMSSQWQLECSTPKKCGTLRCPLQANPATSRSFRGCEPEVLSRLRSGSDVQYQCTVPVYSTSVFSIYYACFKVHLCRGVDDH